MASTPISRRNLLRGSATVLCGLGLWPIRSLAVACAALTGKTLRWVVPFRPGGGFDTYSRLLEPVLETELGVEIVVANVVGAGGMVAVKDIRSAPANGLTLGIVDAPSLLIDNMAGAAEPIRFGEDLAILGRVARDFDVWITAAGSGLNSIVDVRRRAAEGGLVFGASSVPAGDWLGCDLGSELLGLERKFLTGFDGTGQKILAMVRGELDVTSLSWASARKYIDSGEARVLMQVSSGQIDEHPALASVPWLGGTEGLAAQYAKDAGLDQARAIALANALSSILAAGRMIVSPPGLDPALHDCLEAAVYAAMTDPLFVAAAEDARRPIDPARGAEVMVDIQQIDDEADALIPIIRRNLEKTRA